jgi:aspartate racemase
VTATTTTNGLKIMTKIIRKIGVIGGLGPLASASFVEDIYSSYLQNAFLQKHYSTPYVYLYSEPLITQSTSLMSIRHTEVELFEKLEKNIGHLLDQQKVDCLIICCFTAHVLIPKLTSMYQNKILSLATLVLKQVLEQKQPAIVLSAPSAIEAGVFKTHPLWSQAATYISFMSKEHQEQVNQFIKAVKQNKLTDALLDDFLNFIKLFFNYKLLICCAELHILYKKLGKQLDDLFDPFGEVISHIFSVHPEELTP